MPPTTERVGEILAALDDPSALAALSDDALKAYRGELTDFAKAVYDGEVPVDDRVETMSTAADYVEGITFTIDSRAARSADVKRRLGIVDDPEPEPVPAATPSMPSLGTVQPPAAQQPTVTGGDARIMRMRDRQLVGFDDIVDATVEAIDQAQNLLSEGGGRDYSERIPVGRFSIDYPEDRRVDTNELSPDAYNSRFESLTAGAWGPEKWNDLPESLTASGGFCAPAQPDYEIFQISGTQRPVAGYLPTVQAPRGQIIVTQPPKLLEVLSSTGTTAGSAVSVWTNAVDTNPAGAVKPVQTMTCPAPITVATEAIVQQVKAGNFQQRANPELVAAFLANVASQWARRAESELLRQIDTNSTAVTTTAVLGAVNDFVGYVRRAAAQIRGRQRMPHDARLRLLAPAWSIDFFASDIAHNHPGDGINERFGVTEESVRGWLSAANINVTFYEDSAGTGAANMVPGAQAATDLSNWPPGPGVTSSRLISYLFPEGTFARADAGTLDLGIVRDATLNGTNDFAVFSESWEAVVPKVIESLKITSTLCDTGAGAIDVASSAFCTSS
jgi:hypothetical protein